WDARGVGRVKNLTDLRVEPSKVKHELTRTISDRKDRPCGPASPIRGQELPLRGARPGLLAEGRPVRALTPGRTPRERRTSKRSDREGSHAAQTGGKDATESPGVPGRRRVVERCAADQVYACRRGGGLRLDDPCAPSPRGRGRPRRPPGSSSTRTTPQGYSMSSAMPGHRGTRCSARPRTPEASSTWQSTSSGFSSKAR